MKRFFLVASFFLLSHVLIIITIIYSLFLSYEHKARNELFTHNSNRNVAFAALPSVENVFEDNIIFKDARIEIVKQFFEKYKSPLAPYAPDIVKDADKYGLDHRLLPAIAMQESNLCHKIITDSYNCWGFGIYGKKVTRFESYPEAIDTVSRTLAKNYIAGGLDTPEKIMKKYTPSNNGSWAYSVNYFMNQLQ